MTSGRPDWTMVRSVPAGDWFQRHRDLDVAGEVRMVELVRVPQALAGHELQVPPRPLSPPAGSGRADLPEAASPAPAGVSQCGEGGTRAEREPGWGRVTLVASA